MAQHRMQENRFELKYIIPAPVALGIRDFARSYLEPDEHADVNRGFAYNIHSVYMDSPDLTLCRQTMHGHKNRFKLRVRYYDGDPAHPVFFEIKRRVNDAILKRRAVIRREAAMALIDGQCPGPDDLVDPGDLKSLDAIQQFWEIASRIEAGPTVIVSYNREARVTAENNSLRLTFDRGLTATRFSGRFETPDVTGPSLPTVLGVILELKFTDRFPFWMRELVQTFDLYRTAMAKYVHCINATRLTPITFPVEAIEAVL